MTKRERGRMVQRSSPLRWPIFLGLLVAVVAVVVLAFGGGSDTPAATPTPPPLGLLPTVPPQPTLTAAPLVAVSPIEPFTVVGNGDVLPTEEPAVRLPGASVPTMERRSETNEHVAPGTVVTYNSNPPTSGLHYQTVAQWGIYDQALPDGALVHNLEHGGVIVSYRPDSLSAEELELLRAQVRQLSTINPRVILTPRENLDAAVALTAWGYIQKTEGYDPVVVEAFYKAHVARRGPECRGGRCPV